MSEVDWIKEQGEPSVLIGNRLYYPSGASATQDGWIRQEPTEDNRRLYWETRLQWAEADLKRLRAATRGLSGPVHRNSLHTKDLPPDGQEAIAHVREIVTLCKNKLMEVPA